MTTKPTLIEIDPNGAWRRNRFDFCNALEAAVDTGDQAALELLAKMGIRRKDKAEAGERR